MSLTAGILSLVANQPNVIQAASTAATGGTGPYTQQWYRSTDPAFSPGGGNILAGQTALALNDTTVVPGTQYYYKVVYTDTGHSNDVITSANLAVASVQQLPNINSFTEGPLLGMLDEKFNYDTIPCQIDASQSGVLFAGQAVKIVDNSDGVPKVVAIAADTDDVFGFINYNIKNKHFKAGDAVEISQEGNVIYLMATAAISRGARVSPNILTIGGVQPLATGKDVSGWAFDKASAPGQLIRVRLLSPSFIKGA